MYSPHSESLISLSLPIDLTHKVKFSLSTARRGKLLVTQFKAMDPNLKASLIHMKEKSEKSVKNKASFYALSLPIFSSQLQTQLTTCLA